MCILLILSRYYKDHFMCRVHPALLCHGPWNELKCYLQLLLVCAVPVWCGLLCALSDFNSSICHYKF